MSTAIKTHQPCDDCGSSDALSYYEDHTYCFSCHTRNSNHQQERRIMITKPKDNDWYSQYQNLSDASGMKDRGITSATCKAYGVAEDDLFYWFPYHDSSTNGDVCAIKKRSKHEKKFHIVGQWEDAKPLFGMTQFSDGGKYVTITEGEADCLAVYQMLGSKFPVVSIKSGAGSAMSNVKDNYEWLDSFEHIVVCMDNDEQGKEAAQQIANVFGSKVKIFKSTSEYKDGCDYLKAGQQKLFMDKWWQSEKYVPDGIIDGSTLWEEVSKPIEKSMVNYPYAGLNKLTYGIREAELVTITAGSGLGKSQFLREVVWHVLNNTQDNIGLMFLEESTRKTARSLMSLAANKPLHLPDVPYTEDELIESFDLTLGTGRIYLFDHFGSTDIENIISRVRYLAKGLGCKYIFLDHVSIVVSAQQSGDERKAIDEIMTRLRMLVQETGIALFVVSHLKRPDGNKGHEEGAATSLSQLRGSGSIGQLSDIVLSLERNGQAEDPIERHTTNVRVLKNRFSGLTGPACRLLYDLECGRMIERKDDEENVL